MGWNDPPQFPRTSATIISDLREMLGRAAVPPPYVLVGASMAGEYARVYTGRYPHDVAGLVFVDSFHPDQREPRFMLSPFNRVSPRGRELICTALPVMARFGILRFMASRMGGPVPSQFSPEREILAQAQCPAEGVKNGCGAGMRGNRRRQFGSHPRHRKP